jgi:hypothetical protein
MIPEPQRTYVLELLAALGPAAKDFVIAGAQAIKFAVKNARGTKDVDFILNVIALRAEPLQLEAVLKRLGYTAIAGARNFQFEKTIPNSKETMRIEFMAPEEFKRAADFRVDVQKGIHARACKGLALQAIAYMGKNTHLRPELLDAALSVDVAGDAYVATHLADAFGPYGIPLSLLTPTDVSCLLAKCSQVEDLATDQGKLPRFLSQLVQMFPDQVLDCCGQTWLSRKLGPWRR